MLATLSEATRNSAGGKATVLGVLLREGLPVPDGFVVPAGALLPASEAGHALREAVARELGRLGDPVVAVRSSALSEDTADASAAGQYESVIGVHGADDVCRAIETCWASARADRVGDYWARTAGGAPHAVGMAVLVQPVIEADASGVMFTPQLPGEPTRIEASWGLGLGVVGGTITPDTYQVASDGSIDCSPGSKRARIDLDLDHGGVITSAVAAEKQSARTLDDTTVAVLAALGDRTAEVLAGPQDVEWAVADGTIWILQARPITAALPAIGNLDASDQAGALQGAPGSHGVATAVARIVRSRSDFDTVRRGEIVVCPYTDPAWTPLFTIAAGVITETGGALSHAAIVAREYGIPAVLGVAGATSQIENGSRITLDGTAGSVIVR